MRDDLATYCSRFPEWVTDFILVLPRRLQTIADEILKHNISVSILGPAGSRMMGKWENGNP